MDFVTRIRLSFIDSFWNIIWKMDWNFSFSYFNFYRGFTTLYFSKFFFTDLIYQKIEKRFSKYIELFKRNEFYYFFIYRFVGGLGIPFFLQNILPVIFNMKKSNYFFSSFLGFIPSFFILNTIGSGLNIYIKQAENFSFINLILTKEIYLPIAFFIIVVCVSTIIKKKIFYDK